MMHGNAATGHSAETSGTGGGRADRVARMAAGVMTALLVAMLLRVAQLQLAPGSQLVSHTNTRVAHRDIAAPRGDIMDRRFRPLGSTEFGYRVFVDPTELPSPPDEAISRLADTIGLPADQIGPRIILAIAVNRERMPPAATAMGSERAQGLGAIWAGLSSLAESFAAGAAEPLDDGTGDESTRKPIRFVRLSGVLDDQVVAQVKALRIPGVHLEQRGIREYPSGALGASIIGKVNIDHAGSLGTEATHDQELVGRRGRIAYVRDARGRPLWVGPGSYEQPKRGGDVRLSLDMELQRIATEELQRGVTECDAAGARAVVLDVATGEILAMVDQIRAVPDAVPYPWPDALPPGRSARNEPPPVIPRARYIVMPFDPGRVIHPAMGRNRCIEDCYEPGSTFKPFVWATITECGAVGPREVLHTGNGNWTTPYGRALHDVHAHPTLSWRDVLVQSSNIGMAQGAERLTHDQMHKAIRRFGFGLRTGVELLWETAGRVTPRSKWSKYTQTSVSFGQEIAVTPLQMARAFCAFARSGDLIGTLPPVRITAASMEDGSESVVHRVLSPEAVLQTRDALREVAQAMEAKLAARREDPESGWRYAIFGKSGTAQIPLGKPPKGKRRPAGPGYFERQYNASFIAAGPGAQGEEPKLVVLVVIDDPGPGLVRGNVYYGTQTAGPVVRRIMERSLAYLGVPPSPAAATRINPNASGAVAD